MIRRDGNQRGIPNRSLSTNNPFRMSKDAGAVSPVAYGADVDPLEEFVRGGSPSVNRGRDVQYINDSYYSAGSSRVNSPVDGSFRKSASPSTNPFLDDGQLPEVTAHRSTGSQRERRPPAYSSAKEEKEKLRDRYRETESSDDYDDDDDSNDHTSYEDVVSELPPSYDEVAGAVRAKAPYPREKESYSPRGVRDSARDPAKDSERRHRYHHHRVPPPLPESRRRESGKERGLVDVRESGKERGLVDVREREQRRERPREREREHSRHRDHHTERDPRERTYRHHHRSHTSSKDKKRNSMAPPPKNVDTIDKMDVTGLFGGSFHHDGPFDACTPHRNKTAKAPPVLAFPADGPNNNIGGAPTKKNAMNEVFGREDLDDDDDDIYQARPPAVFTNPRTTVFGVSSDPPSTNGSSTTLAALKPAERDITAFDARGRIATVEGPTTEGLGSTTFLDGAPASNNAIQEDVRSHARQSRLGINRKKSLSQRLTSTVQWSDNGGGHGANSQKPLSLARSHSGHLENGNDDDDVYLGLPSSNVSRKKSTGANLMRRVRSMKVGRK